MRQVISSNNRERQCMVEKTRTRNERDEVTVGVDEIRIFLTRGCLGAGTENAVLAMNEHGFPEWQKVRDE